MIGLESFQILQLFYKQHETILWRDHTGTMYNSEHGILVHQTHSSDVICSE